MFSVVYFVTEFGFEEPAGAVVDVLTGPVKKSGL